MRVHRHYSSFNLRLQFSYKVKEGEQFESELAYFIGFWLHINMLIYLYNTNAYMKILNEQT